MSVWVHRTLHDKVSTAKRGTAFTVLYITPAPIFSGSWAPQVLSRLHWTSSKASVQEDGGRRNPLVAEFPPGCATLKAGRAVTSDPSPQIAGPPETLRALCPRLCYQTAELGKSLRLPHLHVLSNTLSALAIWAMRLFSQGLFPPKCLYNAWHTEISRRSRNTETDKNHHHAQSLPGQLLGLHWGGTVV